MLVVHVGLQHIAAGEDAQQEVVAPHHGEHVRAVVDQQGLYV
jgi:hypothetical protein